jgi:S-adenosylmethionine decarboxylase
VRDLAPSIHRQRLVVEGITREPIQPAAIEAYLTRLSGELAMEILLDPVTHCSDRYGWAGWIHWEASGAHFYAWDQPQPFFSVDIYTCKPFAAHDAVGFTKRWFDALDVEYREF